MCRTATIRAVGATCFSVRSRAKPSRAWRKKAGFWHTSHTTLWLCGLLATAGQLAFGQASAIEWRHIGNSAVELALPSVATGAVNRVWYSADGSSLYARTGSGRIFETNDFESWKRVAEGKLGPPLHENPSGVHVPEEGARVSGPALGSARYFAVGQYAYRSDDGGLSWLNLTAYKGRSILGEGMSDVAVSPRDPDEVVVASIHGLWRSVDGGLSWAGINESLPNLPSGHLFDVPNGTHGVRLALAAGIVAEWAPGEKAAWRIVDNVEAKREQDLKDALSQVLGRSVTAIATAKDYIYAGDSDGRLQVSPDGGTSWGSPLGVGDASGPVQAIWVDPNDPRLAIAVLQSRGTAASNQNKATYVVRTMNGGIFWDDITANLPENAAGRGVAADRATGAIYIATDAGVFYTITELASAGSATSWTSLGENLPQAAATDVKLDAGANQIYLALDGYGVYTAVAPHRLRAARLVSAADYAARPAAPGALLSILGTRVESARSDNNLVPVLDATAVASQIQVPFEAKGNTFSLSVDGATGPLTFGLPLQNVSPAIVVDPEGTPLIMDAGSGVLLDAAKPAHANARIQILATGLGQVTPDWPTGRAAPLTGTPRVVANVRGYLNGEPIEVAQATLAPGYVGFYLIEIQLPRIVNSGPAELYIESEGQQSNRVRISVEP